MRAKNQDVGAPGPPKKARLPSAHITPGLGIAKTAREEKKRARDLKLKDAEMMKLYRQHVLQEQPAPELVQLGGIQPAKSPEQEEVGSFGD